MHVAVFGAGALGAVYGVRLAARAGAEVTFVVRPEKVETRNAIVVESVRGGIREAIEAPQRAAVVPPDADVILLAVRTESLVSLANTLAYTSAPIVILTPMLPDDYARVRAALGERAIAAMPSVVAYARDEDGVVRYWLPPAPTRIASPPEATIADARGDPRGVFGLVRALREATIRASVERDVQAKNAATTSCFIAIGMAVAIAGSASALERDEGLMTLTAEACREGVRIGRRLGTPLPWAGLAPALAAPWAMRAWLGALRRLSPEGLTYFEVHFGHKLRAQHRSMARALAELARVRALPHAALDQIARRLDEPA